MLVSTTLPLHSLRLLSMTSRTASVLVSDDMLFGLTGKVFLHGVYTSDITISGDVLVVPQLVFYFTVWTPKARPFSQVNLKVTPPGEPPSTLEIPIGGPHVINPDRPHMILRAPILLQQVALRPGKIETQVLADGEEIDAGGIWVTSVAARRTA